MRKENRLNIWSTNFLNYFINNFLQLLSPKINVLSIFYILDFFQIFISMWRDVIA